MTPYEQVTQHFELPFPLYPFQVGVVNELAPIPDAGYWMDTGCVDATTEYLSETGWKPIGEYRGGRVAQYNLDGSIEFVTPDAYVKLPCPDMIRIKTKYGVDQLLSPEHRVLFKSPVSDRLHVVSAAELMTKHRSLPQGFRGKFITTFRAPSQVGLSISDAELRVQVAVVADGYFPSPSTSRVVVSIKKRRKIERLRQLLAAADIDFTETAKTGVGSEGFRLFTFYSPIRVKEFDAPFWSCSPQQLQVVADEVRHWDGSAIGARESFSTTSKASADFIQYAYAAAGRRSVVKFFDRVEKVSREYEVAVNGRSNLASINGFGQMVTENVRPEPSPDGFKYCFKVPSTFLILRRNGCIFATGNTGKTATSTVAALFKVLRGADVVIVTMPPILLTGWNRWLTKIRPALRIVLYRGNPRQREALKLDGQFILMSQQIFKRDYERIVHDLRHKRIVMIVDEATCVKNIATDNYKMVRDFVADHEVMLLSGTPLSTPMDAYAYTKLVAPTIYRNMKQFENIHVAERDFFGSVTKWDNLDLLAENMKVNSVRLLKTEVLQDLPPVTYDPLYYELDPQHYRLYRQLAEEQLLPLKDGGKIDATSEQALHHALGQICLNWGHFADDPKLESKGFELVEEILEELAGKKLVVFASYRMTNRTLVEKFGKKFGAVAAFGDLTVPQQQRNIMRFIDDDKVKLFIGQPTSMGVGVDGLQHVCNDAFFLELPPVPKDFHQAVARLWRDGQARGVTVRIGVATGTLQVRKMKQMLDKDTLVNRVQRNYEDLRNSIFGD